jgi:C4-dicarboxylate-specific signal transduction histidine kinase
MVQFLREEATDAATLERALSNMALSVDHLLQISRTLGQFSRTESTGATPVALETIVYEATRMLSQQHLGQQVTVSCSKNLNQLVNARASELRQVFLNLFINAAQAMEWSGTIHVNAEPVDSGIKVSVRDAGPGIPDEVMSQLFEPFFTTKRTGDGIGLGLTICSQILREHGGLLSVENHPDGGALFHFVLPNAKTDAGLQ